MKVSSRDRHLRRGGADIRVHMVLEALEILVEHVDEALGRLPEGRFVLPGLDRVEDMRLDARDGGWHRESEIRVAAEISPVERAVERGGEKATRDPDRH